MFYGDGKREEETYPKKLNRSNFLSNEENRFLKYQVLLVGS